MLSIIGTIILIASACDDAEIVQDVAAEEREEHAAPGGIVDDGQVEAPGTCATLFEHINFGGDRREVNNGASVRWIGGPWNDQVSSMKVRNGCVLNAYEHVNFGGAHATFLGHVPWVGNGWNDKMSSFTCRC